MADLIDRDALEAKIRENSMRIRFFDPSVNVILHLIRYAPAVNRWISVEDALPEDRQRVLICSKSKRLFDVVFRANANMPSFNTKIFGKVYAWYCEDVIKWMPMPDAYKPPEKE